jgi:hypothetical protein
MGQSTRDLTPAATPEAGDAVRQHARAVAEERTWICWRWTAARHRVPGHRPGRRRIWYWRGGADPFGQHDLERLAGLTAHFRIPMAVCLNRADLNPEIASATERWCQVRGIRLVGRIPYDPVFNQAQGQQKSVVEVGNGPAARASETCGRQRTPCSRQSSDCHA